MADILASGYISVNHQFSFLEGSEQASVLFQVPKSYGDVSVNDYTKNWDDESRIKFISSCEFVISHSHVCSIEIAYCDFIFHLTITPVAGEVLIVSFIQFAGIPHAVDLALEAADLGVCEWNIVTNVFNMSDRWKMHLGYFTNELVNEFSTFEQLLHPGDRDRLSHEIKVFLSGDERLFQSEFRLRHKNGNHIWFSCQAVCLRDAGNRPLRIISSSRDITEEKRLNNELELFKQAMMFSPAPCIITDHEGYIVFFNTAFSKKSGWNPEEIIGKKPNIIKSGLHSSDFYTKLWQTITSGNVWQGELKNKRKNGRHFLEQATIIPLRNSRGIITHFAKVAEDITLLRKLENDLRGIRKSAETTNVYKNNFLSNMSHKIRTPLNGIIGFSDLLKNADVDEKQQKQYVHIIQQNGFYLMQLIDYMMDIALIESNQLKIKKESCSLEDILLELKSEVEKLTESKEKNRVELRFIVPKEPHHTIIFTDPLRLKQILLVLFENALKQTDQGFIEIGYQLFSERKLQFYVQDTGAGISEEHQEVIIQQLDDSRYKAGASQAGMGLGLTICRGLVRLMGGQMGLKSKKGSGTIIYFTIPYDKIKIQTRQSIIQKAKRTHFDFSGYTILVAEDVAYNFEYLKNIFAETGATLIWARDGIDVLNIFNNQHVDLILMDIQLPEISGYEATLQIRKKNKDIPVIAQTGYTLDEDHERCLKAGCNDILIKPFKVQDVLLLVSKYLKTK